MYSLLPSSVRLKERYLKMVNLAILGKVYCYLGSKSLGFCHLINSPLSISIQVLFLNSPSCQKMHRLVVKVRHLKMATSTLLLQK